MAESGALEQASRATVACVVSHDKAVDGATSGGHRVEKMHRLRARGGHTDGDVDGCRWNLNVRFVGALHAVFTSSMFGLVY